MVEISKSGSGEGLGGEIPRGYSTMKSGGQFPTPSGPQAPIAYDSGLPTLANRFRMLRAISASAFCAFECRARKRSPMIAL